MKNKESRRIVPMSMAALVVTVLLVLFEGLTLGHALEVDASVIARIAPWAYEPFLRVVGEHPDQIAPGMSATNSSMEYVTINDLTKEIAATNTVVGVFDANMGTNETATPLQIPNEEPVNIETNTPSASPDEAIPVG